MRLIMLRSSMLIKLRLILLFIWRIRRMSRIRLRRTSLLIRRKIGFLFWRSTCLRRIVASTRHWRQIRLIQSVRISPWTVEKNKMSNFYLKNYLLDKARSFFLSLIIFFWFFVQSTVLMTGSRRPQRASFSLITIIQTLNRREALYYSGFVMRLTLFSRVRLMPKLTKREK